MGVYNAQEFITQSLESLVKQDYPNFELIISDNGSKDRTGEICRSFARRDSRICYRRNDTNINPMRNAKILLEMSSGVYHHWAADHDLYHPRYLSSLVELMEREGETLAMAYPDTRCIDIHGNLIDHFREDIETRGLPAAERFKKVLWGLNWCTPMYGLFRSSILKKVWKMRAVTGPDRVFLPELSLVGEYAHHPESLFSMRKNRPSENYVQTQKRHMKWFVRNPYESFVPSIMRDHELIKVVHASNLDKPEKEDLIEDLLRYHHTDPNRHSSQEVKDLVSAGIHTMASPDITDSEKGASKQEYLRIAKICRIFHPDLGFDLDRLCDLSGQQLNAKSGSIAFNSDNSGQPDDRPLVSIGLTVHNQSPYLKKTIESLLAQSYRKFELLIADNASDDGSSDICDHYGRQDDRIRFFRNDYNVGKLSNLDLVLKSSRGRFFLWASGHDVFHPDYLSSLVNAFNDNDASVVYCYPGTVLIDHLDRTLSSAPDPSIDTRGMSVADGFRSVIRNFKLGNTQSGLFRTSAIKKVWQPYFNRGSEHILAAQLSLVGDIVHIENKLFFKRKALNHGLQSFERKAKLRSLSLTRHEAIIPHTMLALEHVALIQGSALSQEDKLGLIEDIKQCFAKRYRLKEEAILFLQNGVELAKSDFEAMRYGANAIEEVLRLAELCALFNPEYQSGYDQFAGLLKHKIPN